MKIVTFLLFGHISLALGIIGAALPVLPTTPFLLLAAYFYSKSNPKLHTWLLQHKYFGPALRDWHHQGVIGLKSKIVASFMILLVVGLRFPSLQIPFLAKALATTVLLGVLVFIWSRPSKTK